MLKNQKNCSQMLGKIKTSNNPSIKNRFQSLPELDSLSFPNPKFGALAERSLPQRKKGLSKQSLLQKLREGERDWLPVEKLAWSSSFKMRVPLKAIVSDEQRTMEWNAIGGRFVRIPCRSHSRGLIGPLWGPLTYNPDPPR